MDIQKKAMVEALEKSLGIVTTACRAVGVARATHYNWMRDDPEYRAAVESLADMALDFGESQLHKLMQEGSPAAVIFFLKTKGKGRGYVEGSELKVYTPDHAPSWLDGSPIGDIAGYRVLYGRGSGQYDQVAEIDNPSITRYVVENLGPGNWFFAVTVRTEDGLESAPSAEVRKRING